MSTDILALNCEIISRSGVLSNLLRDLGSNHWVSVAGEVVSDMYEGQLHVVLSGKTAAGKEYRAGAPIEMSLPLLSSHRLQVMESLRLAIELAAKELHLSALPPAARYVKA